MAENKKLLNKKKESMNWKNKDYKKFERENNRRLISNNSKMINLLDKNREYQLNTNWIYDSCYLFYFWCYNIFGRITR